MITVPNSPELSAYILVVQVGRICLNIETISEILFGDYVLFVILMTRCLLRQVL